MAYIKYGLYVFLVSTLVSTAPAADISGIDKVVLLRRLWEGANFYGWKRYGSCEQRGKIVPIKDNQIKWYISSKFIHTVNGKSLCISLQGDSMDTVLYNTYNGSQSAEKIIASLKKQATLSKEKVGDKKVK